MPYERHQLRARRGYINLEALVNFSVFCLVAAILLPLFERLGWRWMAIPLAIISLVLGALASLEAARWSGRAAGVGVGLVVLAVTALGVYRLAT